VAWRDELERIYREDGARMWRAVFLYTRDTEIASDAVAEAFAQALRRDEGIRSPSSWLWTASFRLAAGELHRRRQEAGRMGSDDAGWVQERAAGRDEAADVEVGLDVMRALSSLSERQRVSVVLYYYAGYRVLEIARIIGSTPGAVAVHLHRARARMREQMKRTEGDHG
jgi:RNA polymerase sigma-70 factor (ECF subfamily)